MELITALGDCDGHKERSAIIARFIRDGPGGRIKILISLYLFRISASRDCSYFKASLTEVFTAKV